MALAEFIRRLMESGQVRVGRPGEEGAREEMEAVRAAVEELDGAARLEMAGGAPELSLPAAVWGAERLYGACQFLVYRDVEAEVVKAWMGRACPGRLGPEVCYSVDLVMQYMPGVISLARGIAEGDPLVEAVMRLAGEWPLSSVGVRGIGRVDVSGFIDHIGLRRLYADRIIERADGSRLDDPRAAEAVREALGMHTELVPALVAGLSGEKQS